jgi:hypothetical protein
MNKVSSRTLFLLVVLLALLVAHQSRVWTPPAQAGAVWLAGEATEASRADQPRSDPQPF